MRLEALLPVDTHAAWGAWLSTQSPALPAAGAMPWVWHAAWALVLAACVAALPGRLPRAARTLLAGGVLVWTLLPTPWSPAFVLGLVFQAPSLVLVLLCGRALLRGLREVPVPRSPPTPLAVAWGLCAVLLGWALLLDTFALLPVQLYAAGFGRAALLAVGVVLGGLWVLRGGDAPGMAACVLLALGLFTLLRWPTGNLWDALLDPLLWAYLQLRGLGWLLRGRRVSGLPEPSAARATRA